MNIIITGFWLVFMLLDIEFTNAQNMPACSGRGTQSGYNGACVCNSIQYHGTMCEIDVLAIGSCMITSSDVNYCNNEGRCSTNYQTCMCNHAWSGPSCTIQCNGNGVYSGGTCACNFGFTGPLCQNDLLANGVCLSVTSPTVICSGNGACSNGINVCTCSPGWIGTSCDIPICHDTTITFNGTLCTGNGRCSSVMPIGTYCTCNPGWTGTNCDQWATNVCDCGVTWKAPSSFSVITNQVHMITAGSVVPSDTRLGIVNVDLEQIVGTVDQAKYICYSTAACDGFLLHTDNSLQLTAAFYTNTGSSLMTHKWQHYVDPPPTIYVLDRYSNNRCVDPTLDPVYYTRTYFQEILNDCINFAINSTNTLFTDGSVHQASDCRRESIMSIWANLHWQHRGYVKRYNPNLSCGLLPTLYDPLTNCATARVGCFGFPHPTDKPCSGQGYCDAVAGSSTSFLCNCDLFPGAYNHGITLAGTPMFAGRACQYNMISSCSGEDEGVQSVLCSSYIDACTVDKVWDGVSVFNTSNSFDYRPRCHCEDTLANVFPALGTNCQDSRCGDDTLRCNTAADNHNVCTNIGATPTDSLWGCTCGARWIGPQCQYDASICLHNGLQCSGHGTCMLANPAQNHTTPYCVCNTISYSGTYCERQECPASIMAIGHGECFDNILKNCFPVYRGGSCQFDVCAQYGGSIVPWSAGSSPSQCACATGWSASQPNDPSCWPLCAIHNGMTCGGLDNTCDLVENNGIRTASCLCSPGFIEVADANGRVVCEQYCIHGAYDSTMSWDQHNPPPCLCHGTGFDTSNGHPRCDNVICKNNGVYVAASNSCTCPPPFTSYDNCVSNTCNNRPKLDQLIRGVINVNTSMCACNQPFLPLVSTSPIDCDGRYCGPHGNPLMTWTHFMPARYMCSCTGKYQTTCATMFDTTSCRFCSVTTCLNGGVQIDANPNVCNCFFPFINGDRGLCEINTCSIHTSSYNATSCICSVGYTGDKCEVRVYIPPPTPIVIIPVVIPIVTPIVVPPVIVVTPPIIVVTPVVTAPAQMVNSSTDPTQSSDTTSLRPCVGIIIMLLLFVLMI